MPSGKLTPSAFLVLGALFGICYDLFVPPLQAPDEIAHFIRAYSVSSGFCLAPRATPIPLSVIDFARQFPPHLEAAKRIDAGYILRLTQIPLEDGKQTGTGNVTANMYSCVPYVPAALGIGAGRLLSVSPPTLLYIGRLANLMAYLAIVTLALRQLPGFQIPMLCIALMPMALSQAASISGDAIAFSTAFFLCAYIVKLSWESKVAILQLRQYWTLAAVMFVASQSKTDAWLAPLLILVPSSKFGNSRRKWTVILGLIALSVITISGWNYLNRDNGGVWVEFLKGRHIELADNAAFMTDHPVLFVEMLGRTMRDNGGGYVAEFVGKLGWLVVALPTWIVWLYILLLAVAAVSDGAGIELKPGDRMVCLGIAAVAAAAVFVGMWCAETTAEYKDVVLHGRGDVPGVQGRYFIAFAFPLLLAISNNTQWIKRSYLFAAAVVTTTIANAAAIREVLRTYYY